MSIINVLPTEVANKIAAGEVVERPASVVKELIENSIDAGADKITVEIKNGGISYIRITDNGKGMSYDDAKKAFLRHATSKLKTESDLQNIITLGFRGEALASIAAVSDVELITKNADNDGVYIELKAGTVIKDEFIGCPDGTTLVVKNLFYNVPARMKFLKKDSTEGGYITDVIQRQILANPDISFKYIIDGKEKLFHNGDGQLKTAIYNIYGKEYADNIIQVERSFSCLKISGFIGKSNVSRSNRSYQSLFVNGRYVYNKTLAFRIEQGFETNMMVRRFPFYVLNIEIAPENIDVNVHPTKQEIKFADERFVANEVFLAIKDALSKENDVIRNEIKSNISFVTPVTAQPQEKVVQLRMEYVPKPQQIIEEKPKFVDLPKKKEPDKKFDFSLASPKEMPDFDVLITTKPDKSYKVIGQVFDTYIIIELKDKVVLIDQHAAHERMIYEKLIKMEKQNYSQMLLSPIVISLNPKDFEEVLENKEHYTQLGFDFDDFGSYSLLVRATPDGVDAGLAKDLILELLAKFTKGDFDATDKEALHMIACKAALKGNSKLSDKEIELLVDELVSTGGINSCPHGRPIMISYSKYELEKQFKRIQ